MLFCKQVKKYGFKLRNIFCYFLYCFKNYLFKVEYEVINIARLVAAFEGKSEISLDDIYDRGLCPFGAPVKILGEGELSAAIKVEAHKFSQSAAEKIRAAGGEVKELEVEG